MVKIYNISFRSGYIRILKLSNKVFAIITEKEYRLGVNQKRGTTKKMTDTGILMLSKREKKSDFLKRVRIELKNQGLIE